MLLAGLGPILFRIISVRYLWIYIVAAVLLSAPIKNAFQQFWYQKLQKQYTMESA